MVASGEDALRDVFEATSLVVSNGADLAVFDLACVAVRCRCRERAFPSEENGERKMDTPDRATINVDDALEAHADAQNGDPAREVSDSITGYTRVGGRMSGARRDDERLDVEPGQGSGGYGIVADDGDTRTKKGELLVEIPRKRVEIVDQQTINRLGERGGETRRRRCHLGKFPRQVTLDVHVCLAIYLALYQPLQYPNYTGNT